MKTTEELIAYTGNIGYSSYCIYGENKDSGDVLKTLEICEGCISIIEKNIYKYNHS